MPHWYDKNGQRVSGVPYADKKRAGEMRDPTLRDARKHGWAPGVTDCLKMLPAQALVTWKVRQGIIAAKKLAGSDLAATLSDQAFIAQAEALALEEAITKASLGTEIHDAISSYILTGVAKGHEDICLAVTKALKESFPEVEYWESEVPFYTSTPLPYGGTIDLIGYDANGFVAVLPDIKTKEFLPDKMGLFIEHYAQLALYEQGIGANNAPKKANLFVDYGADVLVIEHTEEKSAQGLEVGNLAVRLFYALNEL